MFNQTHRYALRACAVMAALPPSTRVLAKDLARETGIPPQYLSKILHKLARSGLLASRKGIGGGFYLVRDPAEITLREVVSPFTKREDAVAGPCMICDGDCGRPGCVFRAYWQETLERYLVLLDQTTLADVAYPRAARRVRGRGSNHRPAAAVAEHWAH